MAGEQIVNKHKLFSIISHEINGKGDDDDDDDLHDLILNTISERTDKALALINSCDLSILNTLRQSSTNRSLLHICVGIGWYKAVVQLLKRSVDVNIIDDEQQTPLMLSVNHFKTDIFKCLIKYDNININYQRNFDGFNLLHLLIINDLDRYLKIFFQEKNSEINFNLKTNLNKNFLHLMSDFKSKKSLNIIKKFFSFNHYLWQEKDHQGYTPLFIAIIRWPYSSFTRHLLILFLNLSSKSLSIQDYHGKTILHWAIFNHHLVKLITDKKYIDLYYIKDKFGKIPLDYVYEQQLFKSIEYLKILN